MMMQAKASLDRLYTAKARLTELQQAAQVKALSDADREIIAELEGMDQRFIAGMNNDFNTAEAMGALFELVYLANTRLDEDSARETVDKAVDTLKKMTDIFGILTRQDDEVPEAVQALAARRAQARKDKNWAESDALRDEIASLGYAVEDSPQGQKLRRR